MTVRTCFLIASLALQGWPGIAVAETLRPVISEIVTSERASFRSFPGVVAAEVETTLAFQTSGRLAVRRVDVGDAVQAGADLAALDQVTLAEDVAVAEAALSAAVAEADLARRSLSRVEELARRGVAATAQLEAAQAQADAADARTEAARANLSRANDAASFGTLTAPESGVVTQVFADPGAELSPATPVLSLATEAGREAQIDVPEEALAVVSKGTRFLIASRQHDTTPVGGTLQMIEPVATSGTRGYRLRIRLDPDGDALRIGALVTAWLDTVQAALLTIPVQAVIADGTGPRVWIIGAERRAELRDVTLGAEVGGRVVVTGGLAEGDEVLVRGVRSVEAGQQLGPRISAE